MKISFDIIPEPKIAETDLYARGKKIPANNKKGFILDHSQPRRGYDFLRVYKGNLYYEWIDDDGNKTFEDKSLFDDMLKVHRIEDNI